MVALDQAAHAADVQRAAVRPHPGDREAHLVLRDGAEIRPHREASHDTEGVRVREMGECPAVGQRDSIEHDAVVARAERPFVRIQRNLQTVLPPALRRDTRR